MDTLIMINMNIVNRHSNCTTVTGFVPFYSSFLTIDNKYFTIKEGTIQIKNCK